MCPKSIFIVQHNLLGLPQPGNSCIVLFIYSHFYSLNPHAIFLFPSSPNKIYLPGILQHFRHFNLKQEEGWEMCPDQTAGESNEHKLAIFVQSFSRCLGMEAKVSPFSFSSFFFHFSIDGFFWLRSIVYRGKARWLFKLIMPIFFKVFGLDTHARTHKRMPSILKSQ